MNRLNLLVSPLLLLTPLAIFATPAHACTLFEEPQTFNTQTFRLEYPEASSATSTAESNLSVPAAQESNPYAVEPLPIEPRLIIFVGNQPNRTFQVVVTDTRKETLADLRTCVLDAFATQTRMGKYIQVGSFTHRAEAQAISQRLSQAGYPTRVLHVP